MHYFYTIIIFIKMSFTWYGILYGGSDEMIRKPYILFGQSTWQNFLLILITSCRDRRRIRWYVTKNTPTIHTEITSLKIPRISGWLVVSTCMATRMVMRETLWQGIWQKENLAADIDGEMLMTGRYTMRRAALRALRCVAVDMLAPRRGGSIWRRFS